MAKQNNRRSTGKPVASPSVFEQARDEMFQHIMRCGVVGSDPAHQTEWFNETMEYMTDRYPELDSEEIGELRTLGERFAQPPKAKQVEEAQDTASAA